ncbi:MAG: Gfo/Idh/MocA family oxidoreductase [Clostridia bacterium]|nr:Gfo/Idh/MocA family oxidoreductase [Clostridia bacterium]
MKNKRIRLGVLGLNRGIDVTKGIIGSDKAEIAAICDLREDRLQSARAILDKNGVADYKCFTDFEEMLRSDIDAVFIATDAPLHAKQAIQALNAGKHVLSEIPNIDSIEDAIALKAAVKAHPELKYMAAENCCYWAFIQMWKNMHEKGDFGDIVYAESEYLHSSDIYRQKPENDTLHYKGSWRCSYTAIKYLTHNLGPLLYIMNDRCVSVSCMIPDARYNLLKDSAATENGVAIFKTAKGAVIRILICFGAYVGFDHNFALYGTRGIILTDKTEPLNTAHSFTKLASDGNIRKAKEIPITMQYSEEASSEGHGGADTVMLNAFIDCIINDTKPPVDIELGINMAVPGIIAERSAMNGGVLTEIPEII